MYTRLAKTLKKYQESFSTCSKNLRMFARNFRIKIQENSQKLEKLRGFGQKSDFSKIGCESRRPGRYT